MERVQIEASQLKEVVKQAVVEALVQHKELVYDAVTEALEDIAMANAVGGQRLQATFLSIATPVLTVM